MKTVLNFNAETAKEATALFRQGMTTEKEI
jgi:hypothetical protein